LAQGESFRAIKAASSSATVGSAYSMAPGYPKTDSEADRAATTRYHAMNNTFFLHAALKGEYPAAFADDSAVNEVLAKMGVRSGDDKLIRAPLDWVGFHYYTRRIISDPGAARAGNQQHYGTEIESDTGDPNGARDPYTRFHAVMPTEGPLTHAGLEVYPRGIYDLVTQISREYDHPIIELTECGCCYMDPPDASNRIPDARRTDFFRAILTELSRAIHDGARVRAFHAWSLLDNFEWTDGFSQRYGLTWVDFRDQRRIVKDSGLWYGQVAATNRVS
jgi:beta-glucosidase